MGSRQEGAALMRQELLTAGLRLAETTSLSEISANRVVGEAGVAKGSFFHHFGNRSNYLVELHRSFHDVVTTRILDAVDGLPPGRDRLLTGAYAYLDACLASTGTRTILLAARAEPLIAAEVMHRNRHSAALCRPDFVALRHEHPSDSARLWIGLVAEAALVEYDAGARRAHTRSALGHFLHGPTPPD